MAASTTTAPQGLRPVPLNAASRERLCKRVLLWIALFVALGLAGHLAVLLWSQHEFAPGGIAGRDPLRACSLTAKASTTISTTIRSPFRPTAPFSTRPPDTCTDWEWGRTSAGAFSRLQHC